MHRVALSLVVFSAITSCDIYPPPQGEGLASGEIVRVTMGFSNTSAFILRYGEGRFALIDSGEASEEETPLLDKLAELGGRPEDVEHIFFTHGHQDHIGTAGDYPNASLHSLEAEVGIIEGREAVERPLPSGDPELTGLTVDDPLDDGEVMWLGTLRLQVFALPGHTIGSAAYLVDDVLFLGDAAYVSSGGDITGPTWIFSTDVQQSDQSLRALVERLDDLNLEVRTVAPSHSAATGNGLAPLRRYLDELPDA
jgi:glyoxylase-like metal-dependent hydrolase (beta-lactamase superfamily II)